MAVLFNSRLVYRKNGAVALKLWRKSFPKFSKEKKRQLSVNEPWLMPSPIRLLAVKFKFDTLMLCWELKSIVLIRSGGQTRANILAKHRTVWEKKTGVGAGWSDG